MADPTIRAFVAADGPGLAAMLAASEPWQTLGYGERDWEPLFALLLKGQDRDGYVIEAGGQAAGLAVLRRRFLFGDYLELLAVAPDRRGLGLGRRLLEHVEGLAFGRARNLFVCVSDFNADAKRFYERHGYGEVGPLRDLLIAGKTEILMRKSTGPARGKPK